MRGAFSRQVPGLGYAVLLSRLEPRCGSGRLDRHVGHWRALHNLKPHRLLPAAKWLVWHMLHEPAASNCELATEDRPNGLLASGSRLKRFAEACQLPAVQPMTPGQLRTCQLDHASSACRLGSRLQRHVRPRAWQDLLSRFDPACGSWDRLAVP